MKKSKKNIKFYYYTYKLNREVTNTVVETYSSFSFDFEASGSFHTYS